MCWSCPRIVGIVGYRIDCFWFGKDVTYLMCIHCALFWHYHFSWKENINVVAKINPISMHKWKGDLKFPLFPHFSPSVKGTDTGNKWCLYIVQFTWNWIGHRLVVLILILLLILISTWILSDYCYLWQSWVKETIYWKARSRYPWVSEIEGED